MESALTTSPSSACARSSASPDFPAAVGPTTATTGERGTAKGYGRATAQKGGIVQRRRILLAAALATASATVGLVTTSNAGAGPAAPTFGTPSVVDHWVPGNEPDVTADRHD